MSSTPGDRRGVPDNALSAGKQHGLRAVSTSGGVFAVLALDHLSALSATIRPDDPDTVSDSELVETKVLLVDRLAEQASGVLIDPVVGLQPVTDRGVLPASTGLLLGLEDGDYASLDHAPRLFEGWDVARAAKVGADAIKCSFFYDPFAPSHAAHEFVANLVVGCADADLPLFAEPLAPPSLQADRRKVVVETARSIGALGVDVLKLEFPSNRTDSDAYNEWRDACLELTEASPRPWTLLSAGTDFDTFAGQLGVACEAGASGYVAGRAVWQSLVVGGGAYEGPGLDEARRRLSLLSEIAATRATPWSDWFKDDERSSLP